MTIFHRIAIFVVCILGLVALTGCGDELTVDRVADQATVESSEVVMYFPRQVKEEDDLTDQVTGRLLYEDRCLWIAPEGGNERFVVAWHPEFEGGVDEGIAQVLNEEEQIVAKSGDLIRLEGKEIEDYTGSEPLPPGCEDGPFWAAGVNVELIEMGDED